MKITRAHVGKRVLVTWRDPCSWSEEGHEVDTVRGAAAAPVWTHLGWIEDVTDGWVRLRQAACQNAVTKKEGLLVYEELIEALEVWPEAAPPAPPARDATS